MNILFVLTSHDTLGNTGEKTGFWVEEFAAPYYTFADAGSTITLASPAGDYDAIFYPGGHGPMWDLTTDADSIRLIEAFARQKKPISAVCHAPSVLLNAKDAQGNALFSGKRVTGFTNTEEAAVGLTEVVPFLLEDELKKRGGLYSQGPDWTPYSVQDGMLITGQNPASSTAVAAAVLTLLKG